MLRWGYEELSEPDAFSVPSISELGRHGGYVNRITAVGGILFEIFTNSKFDSWIVERLQADAQSLFELQQAIAIRCC